MLIKCSHLSSQMSAETSSKVYPKKLDKTPAQVPICTISWWRTRCGLLAIRFVSVTSRIHLARLIRASNTRNSLWKMLFQPIWTTVWSLSKTRRSNKSASSSRNHTRCTRSCKVSSLMPSLGLRFSVMAQPPRLILRPCSPPISRTGILVLTQWLTRHPNTPKACSMRLSILVMILRVATIQSRMKVDKVDSTQLYLALTMSKRK